MLLGVMVLNTGKMIKDKRTISSQTLLGSACMGA